MQHETISDFLISFFLIIQPVSKPFQKLCCEWSKKSIGRDFCFFSPFSFVCFTRKRRKKQCGSFHFGISTPFVRTKTAFDEKKTVSKNGLDDRSLCSTICYGNIQQKFLLLIFIVFFLSLLLHSDFYVRSFEVKFN